MSLLLKLKRFYRSAYSNDHFPTITDILFTKKKKLAYYGYLGDNNFGDELVYDAAKVNFKESILIPVRRFMPVSLILAVRIFGIKIDGVVIGGGTLIGPIWEEDFFLSLIAKNIPVYVHGTGVHPKIVADEQWKRIFNKKVFGGVRGPLSYNNLKFIYQANIVGDAAFRLFDVNLWRKKTAVSFKRILVNLGTHFEYQGQANSRDEFEKVIKYLMQDGYQIDFLPFHHNDLTTGKEFIKKFPGVQLVQQPKSYSDAIKTFDKYCFAFGERLHFIVMAVMAKTPFFSVNYEKKHFDLLESLNLSHYGTSPASQYSVNFIECFKTKDDFNWNGVESVIDNYKGFQEKEAAWFMALLNSN